MMEQPKWEVSIGELEIKVGKNTTKKIPVFKWEYCTTSIVGYDIKAWLHLGEFTFEERRFPETRTKENCKNIQAIIRQEGLEEPHHMEEVWEDIQKTYKLVMNRDLGGFLQACAEAKERWNDYL